MPFTERRGELNRNIYEQLREMIEADLLQDFVVKPSKTNVGVLQYGLHSHQNVAP